MFVILQISYFTRTHRNYPRPLPPDTARYRRNVAASPHKRACLSWPASLCMWRCWLDILREVETHSSFATLTIAATFIVVRSITALVRNAIAVPTARNALITTQTGELLSAAFSCMKEVVFNFRLIIRQSISSAPSAQSLRLSQRFDIGMHFCGSAQQANSDLEQILATSVIKCTFEECLKSVFYRKCLSDHTRCIDALHVGSCNWAGPRRRPCLLSSSSWTSDQQHTRSMWKSSATSLYID